jgi:hypothetical protein
MAPQLLLGAAGPLRELPVSRILSGIVRSRDDHSSRRGITDALQRPTRRLRRLPNPPERTGPARTPGLGLAADSLPIWSCSVWGLPCPRALQPGRCALTAPFHPYPRSCEPGRYLLCGTSRLQTLTPESRTLSGTLSCGVRTFLPRNANAFRQRSSGNPASLILRENEDVSTARRPQSTVLTAQSSLRDKVAEIAFQDGTAHRLMLKAGSGVATELPSLFCAKSDRCSAGMGLL